MTQQEMKEYYKHIESVSYNLKEFGEIEIIDLYHEKGDSNRHVHLVFEGNNKLYYTGDMGTYVFGNNIKDIRHFFQGKEIDPGYWAQKCEAAWNDIIDKDVDEDKARQFVLEEIEPEDRDNSDTQQVIDSYFTDWNTNDVIATETLSELFGDLDYEDSYSLASTVVSKCQEYNHHYLYACELIQWIENKVF